MSENAPQDSGDERVIRTPEDLAEFLAETFLANADSGDDAANDHMVAQIRAWQRGAEDDELPRRFSGQLFPAPDEPVWSEDDPVILRRVRDGLTSLLTDER